MRLLLVGGLAAAPDIKMLEGVHTAVRYLVDVDVIYRAHPLSHVRQSFFRQSGIRGRSLQEDINWADVVIYTYSTMAEEAFIQGKPVWQWNSSVRKASALYEVWHGLRTVSPHSLRIHINHYRENPMVYIPTLEQRRFVAEQLFYKTDGLAAERIAEYLYAKHFSNHSDAQLLELS